MAGQRQVHVYLRLWRLLATPGAGGKTTAADGYAGYSGLCKWPPGLPTGRSWRPRGYDQRTLDQFSWRYESHDHLLAGEDIWENDVPTWFWTYQPEHFDKDYINRKLTKLYQLKGNPDFLLSQGGYDYFFADMKS
jgi:hypothetical protein